MFNIEQAGARFAAWPALIESAWEEIFTRSAVAMDHQETHVPERGLSERQSLDFELLHLLETEPGLSQRELAIRLGVSLGRTNYCLKALLDKGALKLANFRAAKSKVGYAYVLTPKGIAERAELTGLFLQRKLAEFERLKAQIERLQDSIAPEMSKTHNQD